MRVSNLILAAAAALLPAAALQGQPQPEREARRYETALQRLLPAVRVAGRDYQPRALAEVMQRRNVPAVSIAIIDNGRIAWIGAFGTADAGTQRPVTPDTLFQAASISKPVAATGALVLMDQGLLSLDRPVNEQLTSWRIPDHAFGSESVTLRRLLTHTAGLSVSGFPGYAVGAALPTVPQILDGAAPANTPPVRVQRSPGTEWRYSGGGITVVQLLMTDVTGEPFPQLMQRLVLQPLGMERSTYDQPLGSGRLAEAAAAHGGAGAPIAGAHHVYPEMAAAGLWTTPTDLAKWALAISAAYRGEAASPIRRETAAAMLTAGLGNWGLGLTVIGEGDALRFSHRGSNEGFRSVLMMYPVRGQGLVVMTNGDNGGGLIDPISQAIGRMFGWPGSESRMITPEPQSRDRLTARVGRYQSERRTIDVGLMGESLVVVQPSGRRFEIVPQANDVYVASDTGLRFQFQTEPRSGRVLSLSVGGDTLTRRY